MIRNLITAAINIFISAPVAWLNILPRWWESVFVLTGGHQEELRLPQLLTANENKHSNETPAAQERRALFLRGKSGLRDSPPARLWWRGGGRHLCTDSLHSASCSQNKGLVGLWLAIRWVFLSSKRQLQMANGDTSALHLRMQRRGMLVAWLAEWFPLKMGNSKLQSYYTYTHWKTHKPQKWNPNISWCLEKLPSGYRTSDSHLANDIMGWEHNGCYFLWTFTLFFFLNLTWGYIWLKPLKSTWD